MSYLEILSLGETCCGLPTAVSKDGPEAEGAALKRAYSDEGHDLHQQDTGTTV